MTLWPNNYVTGPLAGGEVEDKLGRGNWGNLVFVIDPELLGPIAEFKAKVQILLQRVKEAKRLPGVDDISLPGERSEERAKASLQRGTIKLERNMYKSLIAAYHACGGK